MTTGFVLGKFAPLHRGHQLLIDTALKENEHVIVMIYHAPDVTAIPLPVRSGWIKSLYPTVQVIEAWDGPMEVGDTPAIKAMHETYILKMLGDQCITRFYSSEFYGEHVSAALGAQDCRIDEARQRVPVSGTAIRQNLYPNRQYLDAVVYRDLITKVVFLGAPSTGKTTLARELAKRFDTVWMPEFGREYWEQHQQDRRLTLEQLVEIAEGHREREDVLISEARDVMFIDTDATTTFMFSMHYHGEVHPKLASLARESIDRYDLFFLCEDDIAYDDTLDRSGEADRAAMQVKIKADLQQRGLCYVSLRGTVAQRVQQVVDVLNQTV